MFKNVFKVGALASMLLFIACDEDETVTTTDETENTDTMMEDTKNFTLNLSGLTNLGANHTYEGWIIVDGSPVSTGIFTVNDNGELSETEFTVDATQLAAATKFVLTIEPAVDDDPAPSATKYLSGDFSENTATIATATIEGVGAYTDDIDAKYFLRTPTDETSETGNNGNDQNGVWFGIPNPDTPPSPTFENMPALTAMSGWRYEGWIVVDGNPISTGTFYAFNMRDSGNPYSGTEFNAGPPVPGEDFFIKTDSAPDVDFPIDVRGNTVVVSLEPYPDNDPAPFVLKPLTSNVADDAATAPTTHNMTFSTDTFPTGSVTRQ